MKSLRFLLGLLLLLAGVVSGPAGTVLRFYTTVGDFDVELFDADKPVTVQNFLRYVQDGSYHEMFLHRVVPDFVVQGGGYNVVNRGAANAVVDSVATFAPIVNEFATGKFYSNVYGTIAMAKTSDPNSATSQFFFNLADNSASLDDPNNSGGFTVFGRIITGTNILNEFRVGPNNTVVKQVSLGPFLGGALTELPVLYSANPNGVTYDDLVYMDVSASPQYSPSKATYNGLFTPPSSVAQGGSGLVTVATTATSKFSGSLRLGNARYSFSSAFNTNGYAVATAVSGSLSPLVVNLHPDTASGTDKLVGTVSSGAWVAGFSADRAALSAASGFSGKYTLDIPAGGQAGLAGDGYASLTVDSAGNAKLKGALADGTPFSVSAPLSKDGRFPLYALLYGGAGAISGWMTFATRPEDDLSGALVWTKPAFLGGIAVQTTAAGARYTPPAGGTRLLSVNDCVVVFSGGGLAAPFTNNLTLNAANKLVSTNANKLTLAVALSTGLFSASVAPPGSQQTLACRGALLQKRNSGYGLFANGTQVGSVWLHP